MRKSLTLILALCFIASSSFAQRIDISTAKSSLNASATDLDQLLTKINEIKVKAEAGFTAEETAITDKKADLEKRRSELEAGNGKEKDMMANEWPARVKAREMLVREESNLLMLLKFYLPKNLISITELSKLSNIFKVLLLK